MRPDRAGRPLFQALGNRLGGGEMPAADKGRHHLKTRPAAVTHLWLGVAGGRTVLEERTLLGRAEKGRRKHRALTFAQAEATQLDSL